MTHLKTWKLTSSFLENRRATSTGFEETDQKRERKQQGGQKPVWGREENRHPEWDSFHFALENHSEETFLSEVTRDSLCCWKQEKGCKNYTFEASVLDIHFRMS